MALRGLKRSEGTAAGLADDRMQLVERYMTDGEDARLAEGATAEAATPFATVRMMPTVEPRNADLQSSHQFRLLISIVESSSAVCQAMRAAAHRGFDFTARRMVMVRRVVPLLRPVLSFMTSTVREMDRPHAGDLAVAIVALALSVGIGLAVAFAA
jgi:hypothetical protein